ncbi:MAG: hypothetical protein M0R50_06925 [Candidatus Cloacimonetes bacterium]|jgi:hypothetical protein|nr:hypothetical protein [Candidatus Cloacimonadota bacterium]
MTHDEIRAESFNKFSTALNEVFPGIKSETDGDVITFDDNAVKVEMSSNDIYEGYFEVSNDISNFGALWGIKPVVSVLITEICRVRKYNLLNKLR